MMTVRERPWPHRPVFSEHGSVLSGWGLFIVACPPCFIPAGVVTQDERPVTIHDTWRLVHRGRGHITRLSQSVVTVEDFETIDAGYYICTAQNLQGQTTVATTVEFS